MLADRLGKAEWNRRSKDRGWPDPRGEYIRCVVLQARRKGKLD